MHRFQVGARVEARAANVDELYYPATVLAVDGDDGYTVEYDNGDVESGLLPRSVLEFDRRKVYSGDQVLVEDGRVVVGGKHDVRWARLFQFKSSLGLYQSGVLLDAHFAPDHSSCPFAVNQVMLLALPLFHFLCPGAALDKVLFLGCGGGGAPACARAACPSADVHVVDTCRESLQVASTLFGLAGCHLHVGDAFAFVANAFAPHARFDVIVCDVTDERMQTLPPPEFLSAEFLQLAKRALRVDRGLLCMNVLAHDANATYEKAGRLFAACFGAGRAWTCIGSTCGCAVQMHVRGGGEGADCEAQIRIACFSAPCPQRARTGMHPT
jgi:hypothetical protein